MSSHHEKLNYLEYPASNLEATKAFFSTVFNWQFTDYGDEYVAFANAGLDGGFFKSEHKARTDSGSALAVFYSDDLEATLTKITAAGGDIIKPIFAFPGGRRFHFLEPSGNEFAVWSDQD